MKSFDLEAVSKGAEFETVEGRECKFGGFSPDSRRVCFWVKTQFNYDGWDEVIGEVDYDWNYLFRMKQRKMKKEIWINVYPEKQIGVAYDSQEEADLYREGDRVACIPVDLEWTE